MAHHSLLTLYVYLCPFLTKHPCITTVMGAVLASGHEPMLVMEYCEYGSLADLLSNETMQMTGELILQIVRDISQGLRYLHSSKPPILHGDLKAKNILVRTFCQTAWPTALSFQLTYYEIISLD